MRLSRPRRCDAAHGRRRQGQPTRVLYTELCPAPLFLKIAGLFSSAVYTLMVSPRKEDTMRASDKAYAALRDDIDELFELRQTLEGKAAALAARRGDTATFERLQCELLNAPALISGGDPALHDYYELVGRLDTAIDAAISNSYLAQAMRSLRVHLVRIRRLAADDANRLTAAAAEHAAIAEAIAAGNPALAEAATIVHLHRSLSHVKATHASHPKEHHG